MSREWKPGDVARTIAGGTIARTATHKWILLDDGHPIDCDDDRISRPLVVIDPEDAEQVERLSRLLWPHYSDNEHARLRKAEITVDALREFADPTPPKEPEPLGLGAVVEDAEGRRFIRVEPDGGQAKWVLSRALLGEDPRHVWSAIDAVRVLSHGVTEGES